MQQLLHCKSRQNTGRVHRPPWWMGLACEPLQRPGIPGTTHLMNYKAIIKQCIHILMTFNITCSRPKVQKWGHFENQKIVESTILARWASSIGQSDIWKMGTKQLIWPLFKKFMLLTQMRGTWRYNFKLVTWIYCFPYRFNCFALLWIVLHIFYYC